MRRTRSFVALLLALSSSAALTPSCGGDSTSSQEGGSGGQSAGKGGAPAGHGGSAAGTGGILAGSGGAAAGSSGGGGSSGGASGGSGGSAGASGGSSGNADAGAAKDAAAGAKDARVMGPRATPPGFPEVYAKDVPALADKIILTFDDGPDANKVTEQVLDTLKQENVKATFCINVRNTGALDVVDFLKDTVRRIVREGHSLCNHTYDHMDLTKMSVAMVEKELADEETVVRTIDPTFAPLTLTRAPFMAVNDTVKEVMPRHGVHVNVDFSPNDFNCQATTEPMLTTCANMIRDAVLNGGKGIILMHSFNLPTAKALPQIITGLRAKGKQFATVEDVVKGKYNKTSYDLYYP